MAMFGELEGAGEGVLPVTGASHARVGVVWTDEEAFRVGEHSVVLSHAKGLLKAVVTPPPPTDFKFEAEFDNEQLDAAKFGPMPFEARVKLIKCALNDVMSLSSTLAVDDDILKLFIHVPVADFSVTYTLALARMKRTESDLRMTELFAVKKQLADALIVGETLKEENTELKKALAESELKQGDAETALAVTSGPTTERMAPTIILGCPLFLKAIEEGDYDKFVHFYASRREVPADAAFKCSLGDENAMHWAVKYGRMDVLKYLIEDGTLDVNREGKYGRTALINAAYDGHSEAVRLLLAVDGILVDKISTSCTALIYAAEYGHLECVKLLVEIGKATMSIKGGSWSKETALETAESKGHTDIAEYLRSKATGI